MKKIAALLTTYNRKEKTIHCLENLIEAYNRYRSLFELYIFVTDDKSSDGTIDAILRNLNFANINTYIGSGSMFWAGGMRNSYRNASMDRFDTFLLLNDDTFVFPSLFDDYFQMTEYSLNHYGKSSILCGITCSEDLQTTTYGGRKLLNKFWYKSKQLPPNGTIQECDLGNANIMFINQEIIDNIGFLDERFQHGAADYDYTLMAQKAGYKILLSSRYCGVCENDHENIYDGYIQSSIKRRFDILFSPLGLAFSDQLYYMRKNFPFRLPFFFLTGLLKTLFPYIYIKASTIRKMNY